MAKAGLLITGDMHIRQDVPICRTDDFVGRQWHKFRLVQRLVKKNNLLWLDCGDVFHRWNPPFRLVGEFISRMINEETYIEGMVLGNHDLPAHNKDKLADSAIGLCYNAGVVYNFLDRNGQIFELSDKSHVAVYGCSYGENIPVPMSSTDTKILLYHDMVFKDKKSAIPGVEGVTAEELEEQASEYDYIFTGHNHKFFKKGKVTNIGSLTRQTADQINHEPSVMLYIPSSGLKRMLLPIHEGVITREHIEKQEQKEEELNAFVESLQDVDSVSLSFEDTVGRVLQKIKPEQEVIQKVKECIENV